jgi:hypothetical protein
MASTGSVQSSEYSTVTDVRPSAAFVYLWIAATFVLLAGMLSLLLYRALTQRAPAKALVVQGDERWRGVSLDVDGPTLATPLMATLDKSNKYVVSFFLDPGSYEFTVRSGEKIILKETLTLHSDIDTIGIDLANSGLQPPTTLPTTRPAR